jgi:hypothetical protein
VAGHQSRPQRPTPREAPAGLLHHPTPREPPARPLRALTTPATLGAPTPLPFHWKIDNSLNGTSSTMWYHVV